ncbi:hypothetical protein B0J17DRAFT_717186 [Rhizoctonia solani]|nr:hypothetical protein B0J17DRAFT_717186 [Rhizoctonia solani]
MFKNVIPLLIDLWTRGRKFATFGAGNEDYILDTDIWKETGAACVQSSEMMPAAFGCRVQNMAQDHLQSTAESTLIFATLLAPALLRVQLIDSCMALELPRGQIQAIREGFADWVKEFEKLYYKHDPNRLRVCTLPIHSLLHIADDIEAMGPVWCYWAFPMERFCGALGRANLNPQFPFVSMDRRVLEVAQIAQIKYMYNLFDTLNLGDCKDAIAKGTRYPVYPSNIFVRPRRVITVQPALAKLLGAYIGDLYDVDSKAVERRVKGYELEAWGKMQQINGLEALDTVTGHAYMPDTETPRRNATFIKYVSEWDRSVRGRPKNAPEGAFAFGRAEYFVILDGEVVAELIGHDEQENEVDIEEYATKTLAFAVISPIPSFKLLKDCNLVTYELVGGNLGSVEIVDVADVICLVGRVQDHTGRCAYSNNNNETYNDARTYKDNVRTHDDGEGASAYDDGQSGFGSGTGTCYDDSWHPNLHLYSPPQFTARTSLAVPPTHLSSSSCPPHPSHPSLERQAMAQFNYRSTAGLDHLSFLRPSTSEQNLKLKDKEDILVRHPSATLGQRVGDLVAFFESGASRPPSEVVKSVGSVSPSKLSVGIPARTYASGSGSGSYTGSGSDIGGGLSIVSPFSCPCGAAVGLGFDTLFSPSFPSCTGSPFRPASPTKSIASGTGSFISGSHWSAATSQISGRSQMYRSNGASETARSGASETYRSETARSAAPSDTYCSKTARSAASDTYRSETTRTGAGETYRSKTPTYWCESPYCSKTAQSGASGSYCNKTARTGAGETYRSKTPMYRSESPYCSKTPRSAAHTYQSGGGTQMYQSNQGSETYCSGGASQAYRNEGGGQMYRSKGGSQTYRSDGGSQT